MFAVVPGDQDLEMKKFVGLAREKARLMSSKIIENALYVTVAECLPLEMNYIVQLALERE